MPGPSFVSQTEQSLCIIGWMRQTNFLSSTYSATKRMPCLDHATFILVPDGIHKQRLDHGKASFTGGHGRAQLDSSIVEAFRQSLRLFGQLKLEPRLERFFQELGRGCAHLQEKTGEFRIQATTGGSGFPPVGALALQLGREDGVVLVIGDIEKVLHQAVGIGLGENALQCSLNLF